MDLQALAGWIGRQESRTDEIRAAPLAALSATLDRDDPPPRAGDALPPLWHWLFFTPLTRASEIGPDGHAARGGFLPPVPLPRRMWAGGRLRFHAPLCVGDTATRLSRIADVRVREGRSGPLVFVTVLHEVRGADGALRLSEEHDIVYREAPQPGAAAAPSERAPTDATFEREIVADPVLLFRYSALTFNGHRIHYDRSYVTEVEGYPGLIVHGPLIATLLLDLLRRAAPAGEAGPAVRAFRFRALRPVFDIHRFSVCGRLTDAGASLWARDHEGLLAMQAEAELERC